MIRTKPYHTFFFLNYLKTKRLPKLCLFNLFIDLFVLDLQATGLNVINLDLVNLMVTYVQEYHVPDIR